MGMRPGTQGFGPPDSYQLHGEPVRMYWHIAFLLLSSFAALVGRLMPDRQDRTVLARRQQVLIPQRQGGN